jgi:hypothetical protein
MTLISKEYNFVGKISGSVVENKAVTKLNGVELTQDQYDHMIGSSLELPNTPIPILEFEFPYEESQVQQITIYFKSRVSDGIITCERGDYGVFKRDNVYSQKQLLITDNLLDGGTMSFKITSTDNIDIYEVKIEVLYDDSTMRKYSGYISTGDDQSNNREFYNGLTKEEFVFKLNSVSTDTISDFAGTWQPVAGEIIP